MSDELPTAARVPDPGIRALYRLENRWQAWLDVEAALARAEAELGIIPGEAAAAIARCARLEKLDRARLDAGFARTGHTIVPLVWELSRVVGEPHGGWVHWGATTQNITQTGDLLVLRQAHRIFLRLLGEALTAMADLAERGADMPIAARTHGQHALPATFGLKPAVWIDEMLRHVERLRQAAPRLFVAMLGGGRPGPPSRHAADARAGPHTGRSSRRERADPRHDRRHLRQDRARDLHIDEDRVRRGRRAGAARHGRQLDDAAEAQPETVPGHHRRGGGDSRDGAARARGDVHRARGRPHDEPDDGGGRGARGDLDRRHAGPARRGPAGARTPPRAHAAEPRSRRRSDHGRGGHARARRQDRPPARP